MDKIKNKIPHERSAKSKLQSDSHSEYRLEHDSLGEVKVPIDALYGAQTQRAVLNFPISGFKTHPSLIRAYLKIKQAATSANQLCGVLDENNSELIIAAIGELLTTNYSKLPIIFPIDSYQAGAGTNLNMNLNEVIANLSNQKLGKPLGTYRPIHPNDHVNRSQSTNDSFPTAMRLALLDNSNELVSQSELLSRSLRKKAEKWAHIKKAGRTHLQDAVPMELGQEFGAYASCITRCVNWIQTARVGLRELGIGGSAIGTGLNVPSGFIPKILAELEKLTGEKLRPSSDLCEATQSQAGITYYSSCLKILALEVTRICNDLRLLASGPMTGLTEILLPAVQPGSSIMPGKVNPSVLEMTNQTCYSVLGYDQTVCYAAQAGQLELNVMMPIIAHATLEATSIFAQALRVLRERCIDGLEPNLSRLQRYYESTPQIATALSPSLGYEKTAELVQEAQRDGKSVIELVREKKLIPEEELFQILSKVAA